MFYTLEKFGAVILPTNIIISVGSGRAEPVYADTPWGAVRLNGSGKQAMGPQTLSVKLQILETTPTAAQTAADAVKALTGTWDKLYRRMPDGSVQWTTAQMVEPAADRTVDNNRWIQPDVEFFVPIPIWYSHHHGAGWTFDSGILFDTGYYFDEGDKYTLNTSPKTLTIANNGNYAVRNCVITVHCDTTPITALAITMTGVNLVFSGTLAAGKDLVIDCGTETVTNDGAAAYATFDTSTGHAQAEWLALQPGNNSITVTITGGGTASTITFDFWEGSA